MRNAKADREAVPAPVSVPVPIPISAGAAALPPSGRARILVVDDHPIVRQGLTQLINDEPDLIVCGAAESAAEALALAERLQPALVVIDISLGGSDGLELLKEIRDRLPRVTALVLSMHDESLYGERALRAGAKGYVNKGDAPELLMKAIRGVLAGEVCVSERLSAKLLKGVGGRRDHGGGDDPLDRLSNRELQVFRLIGGGMSIRHIAEKLFLSAKTIETHREHIKEKLSLLTSGKLLHYAVQYGGGTA